MVLVVPLQVDVFMYTIFISLSLHSLYNALLVLSPQYFNSIQALYFYCNISEDRVRKLSYHWWKSSIKYNRAIKISKGCLPQWRKQTTFLSYKKDHFTSVHLSAVSCRPCSSKKWQLLIFSLDRFAEKQPRFRCTTIQPYIHHSPITQYTYIIRMSRKDEQKEEKKFCYGW